MDNKVVNNKEHITFLRAIATIAVVLYHSCPSVEKGYIPRYFIALMFNWCVPIFFMISGALFFDNKKQVDFKYMFNKTLHIVKIIFVWGFIYNAASSVIIERSISFNVIKNAILMIFKADTSYCYQFWYLYILVGIYLLIPIFKAWTDKYIEPFGNLSYESLFVCGCWLFLSIVLPTICKVLGVTNEIWLGAFKGFSGYLFLVICGRVYECITNVKRFNKFFYTVVILFVIQLLFMVTMIIIGKHSKIEAWYGYQSFFTWCMSTSLYLFIKKVDFSKINLIVKKMYITVAKYSLHIYILHVIVLQIIRKLGFTNDLINPWIYPVINVSITVCICLVIAFIAKKTPITKHLF